MHVFPSWLVLTVLLVAALLSYAIGFMPGFGVFIILGVVFELGFWIGLFNRQNSSNNERSDL